MAVSLSASRRVATSAMAVAPVVASTGVFTRRASNVVSPMGAGGRCSDPGFTATVFGATGFLGRYVVNHLGRQGTQMIIPFRGDEHDYRHLRPMGDLGAIHFNGFQLLDEAQVRKQVEYSDVVINLIGQDYNSRHFSVRDVNVTGAEIIAKAARDAGVGHFVQLSALTCERDTVFGAAKLESESVVRSIIPDATIIRPGPMFGTEDRFLNKLAGFFFPLPGPLAIVDNGSQIRRPVFVRDVAAAVAAAVNNPDISKGTTFELVGPTAYTQLELIEYMKEALKSEKSVINVPGQLLEIFGAIAQMSPVRPIVTKDEMIRYQSSDLLTGAPGLEDLGVKPTHMEQVALAWLRRFRPMFNHNDILDIDNRK